jgi:hypothetical protein
MPLRENRENLRANCVNDQPSVLNRCSSSCSDSVMLWQILHGRCFVGGLRMSRGLRGQ